MRSAPSRSVASWGGADKHRYTRSSTRMAPNGATGSSSWRRCRSNGPRPRRKSRWPSSMPIPFIAKTSCIKIAFGRCKVSVFPRFRSIRTPWKRISESATVRENRTAFATFCFSCGPFCLSHHHESASFLFRIVSFFLS